jgi:competence protein ComEA
MKRHIIRVTRALSRSSWTPLVGRCLVGLAAFAALAHIGAGAAAHLPIGGAGTTMAIGRQAVPSAEAIVARASPKATATASAAPSSSPCPRAGDEGPIVLNEADASSLTRLPGVGQKRAEAIVRLRDKLGGRFRRLRDLMRVRGIGYKSFKKLAPMLVLDAPAPTKKDDKQEPAGKERDR